MSMSHVDQVKCWALNGMAAIRRLQNELHDLKTAGIKEVREVTVGESVFLWQLLLAPECPPYNEGAFKVDVLFPPEYPFKPPLLTFRTKIYHPNIDEKGRVCLPMVAAENWKATIQPDQIVQALLALINGPEPENPLRHDLAQVYILDRPKFNRIAREYTQKYAIQVDDTACPPKTCPGNK